MLSKTNDNTKSKLYQQVLIKYSIFYSTSSFILGISMFIKFTKIVNVYF